MHKRKVFPMKSKLDGTTLLCWGVILAGAVLTIAILPPIGIFLWSLIGSVSLALWGIEKIGAMIENRKRGK
jgi:hypothetical protein